MFGLCLVCVWSVSMRLASEKCGFCLDRVAGYTGYAGSVRTGSERVCGEWWRRVRCSRATGARGGRQLVEESTLLLLVVVVGLACVLVVLFVRRVRVVLRCVALVVQKVVFVVVCVPDGMASRVVVYAMMG